MFIKHIKPSNLISNIIRFHGTMSSNSRKFLAITIIKSKYSNFKLNLNKFYSTNTANNNGDQFGHYLAGEPFNEDIKFLLKERPNFITGLSDAEGCFIILIRPNNKYKTGWRVEASFETTMHLKDLDLLKKVQNFFNVGSIRISSSKLVASYKVTKLNDLINVIIPHFDKYPLQSVKSIDYQLWRNCVHLMSEGEHLTQTGLQKIVSVKASINRGLSENLSIAFPNILPVVKPFFEISEEPLHPNRVSGFSEGDSSFYVTIRETNHVEAVFSIGLNEREKALLYKIQAFFKGDNKIYSDESNNAVCFRVSAINSIPTNIIPHFDKYVLEGNKLLNYLIWKEIINLIQTKEHLSEEGLIKIKSLRERLNK